VLDSGVTALAIAAMPTSRILYGTCIRRWGVGGGWIRQDWRRRERRRRRGRERRETSEERERERKV